MAFSPLDDVEVAYEILLRSCPEGEKLEEFNVYFERTYIGNIIKSTYMYQSLSRFTLTSFAFRFGLEKIN